MEGRWWLQVKLPWCTRVPNQSYIWSNLVLHTWPQLSYLWNYVKNSGWRSYRFLGSRKWKLAQLASRMTRCSKHPPFGAMKRRLITAQFWWAKCTISDSSSFNTICAYWRSLTRWKFLNLPGISCSVSVGVACFYSTSTDYAEAVSNIYDCCYTELRKHGIFRWRQKV